MAVRVRLQTCTKVHSLFKHYLNMYQQLDEEAKQSNIHIADFQCIALFEQQNNFCFWKYMALDRLEIKIVRLAPPNWDKNYYFVTMMITNSQCQTDMQQRGHKNCLNRQRTRHPFNKYSSKKERKKQLTAECHKSFIFWYFL